MGLAPINFWALEVGRQLMTQSSKTSSMFDGPWYDPLCIFVSCEEEEAKMAVVNNPGEVEYKSGTSLHILELHGPTTGYGTGALLLLVTACCRSHRRLPLAPSPRAPPTGGGGSNPAAPSSPREGGGSMDGSRPGNRVANGPTRRSPLDQAI